MALTDVAARKAKSLDKPFKLSDEKGLYLLVNPNGSKYWRLKYRFAGKEKSLALGVYPEVTLADARSQREDARSQLRNEIDPGVARHLRRSEVSTMEAVAREWHQRFRAQWTENHAETILRRLEANIFPVLGSVGIGDVLPTQLLPALRRVENRGAVETTHRVHQICSQVFQYAIATGRSTRNPAAELAGALSPVNKRHFPSITDPRSVGALLRAIDGYEGSFVTRCALQFAPLVFVRPGELRHAEWSEVNLTEAEWRIPADKMKMRAMHIVPLSGQASTVIEELRPLTGRGKYLFPSERSAARPMSENTINAALRRLGYSRDEMTGHGFRSMASTLLNEQGWNRDAIERQLAHSERNAVRAAYNYAEHLAERRKMIQSWADYLDRLRLVR